MKKYLIMIIFLVSVFSMYGQISGKKRMDPILIFDSIKVNVGDTVYLGKGTKGDFVYIFQPPNKILTLPQQGLSGSYANKYVIVKYFKDQTIKDKGKKLGKKLIGIGRPALGLDNALDPERALMNYVIDFEGGIARGEIVSINGRSVRENKK